MSNPVVKYKKLQIRNKLRNIMNVYDFSIQLIRIIHVVHKNKMDFHGEIFISNLYQERNDLVDQIIFLINQRSMYNQLIHN